MAIRNYVLLVAVWAAAWMSPASAVYDPVFDDGFDCRLWYVDADGDDFGAPGTGELTCTPSVGRVARADDCNDADPAAHPLAPDRPDPLYTDTNCDGSDGDADRAIHVALTGINASGCGTRVSPCRTLVFALSLRTLTRSDLYIQQGIYVGPVVVQPFPGTGIFGGFLADWTRAPGASTEINGGPSSTLSQNTLGLALDGGAVTLGDLRIVAPAANGMHADGTGRGAFALVLREATLTAFGLRLEAGAGAAGAAGSGGGSVPPAAATGSIGGNGSNVGGLCSTSLGGIGGPGASNACPVGRATLGGTGGRGGASDTDCGFPFDLSARPGIEGGDASFVSAPLGAGGGGGSGGTTCSQPVVGSPGAPGPEGGPGAAGTGGAIVPSPSLLRWWRADSGGTGGLGDHGGGGGGGGGSGGCDSGGGNVRGAGGGGGGAGGCRAPVSGAGGAGGGASIALFADNASVTLTQSTLQTAAGGRGGNGGAGILGQPGGPGGEGGIAESVFGNGSDGADGGVGGRGGASGGGGGGAGGASIGILRLAGSLTQVGNTIQTAPGGSGGSGGAAAGTSTGASGASGVQQSLRVCNSVTDC